MTTEERLRILESKVARAERSKRRQLVAGLGVLLGLFALLGAGSSMTGGGTSDQGPTGEKQIRANAFILVDEDGRERASLTLLKEGPALGLNDEDGKLRALLSTDKDGASLGLYDENGKVRVGLTSRKDAPGLFLLDANGKVRAGLGVDKDGPRPMLRDEDGDAMPELDTDTPDMVETWILEFEPLKLYQLSRSYAAIDMRFINSSPNAIQHWGISVEVYDNDGKYLGRGEGMVSHIDAGQSKVGEILIRNTQASQIKRWTATLGGVVDYSGLREDQKYRLRRVDE